MGMNIVEKIIAAHLVGGSMVPGEEAGLRIDQTLTQDATGTMAYLEFESMGLDRVKTERSVAYIDHNTLQSGFENADDHRYIQSVAKKHGIWFSRPGNGICHAIHTSEHEVKIIVCHIQLAEVREVMNQPSEGMLSAREVLHSVFEYHSHVEQTV